MQLGVTASQGSPTDTSNERVHADHGAPMHRDELLQASRRVDWRFLLPDPSLNRVAYWGPAHGTLLDALRLFSAELTVIDRRPERGEGGPGYDVVVAIDPSREGLQAAAERLKPGGFLYVEVRGLLSPARWRHQRYQSKPSPRSATGPVAHHAPGYLEMVQQLGFSEIQAHWHWPDFETCAEIVPLDSRLALQHALDRRGGSVMAPLKAALGRTLLQVGLLERTVPCFSVAGCKQS